MLRLELPSEHSERIAAALAKAGTREIGGILMGEHVGENLFAVREITIHSPGSFARFLRGVTKALNALANFRRTTRYNHKRFNYLGEWHSHPQFALFPSTQDRSTMREIISSSRMSGAQFLVLMIVKLDATRNLQAGLFTYLPDGSEHPSNIVIRGAAQSPIERL